MEKILAHPSPWGGDTTALPKGYHYTLLGLMPRGHQRDSLQVLLRLFLQAQGHQEGGKGSFAATAAIRWLKRYLAGHFRKIYDQISA